MVNITISEELKKRLDVLKVIPRESYNDVISRSLPEEKKV